MACCGTRIEFLLLAGVVGAAIGFGGSRLCSTCGSSAGADEASVTLASYQPGKEKEKEKKQDGDRGHSDDHDHEDHEHEHGDQDQEHGDYDVDAMHEMWVEYGTPGEEHEHFKHMVGTWEAKCTWWMAGPEGEATHTTGSETNELALGGRFVKQTFSGEWEGQQFTGLGYLGYDKAREKYVGIWMDSMSTGIMMTYGKMKDGELVMKGEAVWPGGVKVKNRHVTRVIDNDNVVFEMYHDMGQGEWKAGQIEYTRVK